MGVARMAEVMMPCGPEPCRRASGTVHLIPVSGVLSLDDGPGVHRVSGRRAPSRGVCDPAVTPDVPRPPRCFRRSFRDGEWSTSLSDSETNASGCRADVSFARS
jgi:hypothetical protein